VASESFGPSALATPANAVTIVRLLVAPVLFAMVASDGASWAAIVFWIVLASTDGLDGYIARKQGTTRSGAFLDPLADKVLVLGAMWALVQTDVFSWVPVALIALREIGISVYRSWEGRRGISVPARQWAKVKTVVQDVAVGFALLPSTADRPGIAVTVLWIAVALTLVTGAQYLLDGSKVRRAV
jgi:CDP-diacylglycerol--glycerol-3-phosphate 3-phosphatidyltransferase